MAMGVKYTAADIGKAGEEFAKLILERKGYKYITSNYYTRYGEIDLIAIDDNTIVFLEVKTRKMSTSTPAIFSVTPSKQKKIIKSAYKYLSDIGYNYEMNFRFDVVSIYYEVKDELLFTYDYIENSFQIDESNQPEAYY